jgi:ABC-type transport system involved in cytochrome c biogenesis permease subunit
MKRHWNSRLMLLALALAAVWGTAGAAAPPQWDPRAVAIFEALPIQDHGRIKPLATYARFKLIKLNGAGVLRLPGGEKRSPVPWLMDCLFYPEVAREYPAIRIENPEVMQAAGLPDAKKRARFSFAQVAAAAPRITGLARQFSAIDPKQRTPMQSQMLDLYGNLMELDELLGGLDCARMRIEIPAGHPLAGLAGAPAGQNATLTYSQTLALMPQLLERFNALRIVPENKRDAAAKAAMDQLSATFATLSEAADRSSVLTVIPPMAARNQEAWASPGELLRWIASVRVDMPGERALAAGLEQMAAARGDLAAFNTALDAFVERQSAAAGPVPYLGLEVAFYKARYFYYSLILFVLGFIASAVLWLAPRNRLLAGTAWSLTGAATLLMIAGITLRCIIRGRPPITTLYETTLFVPAVAVVLALILEWLMRNRIALSMAAFFGALGLFMANRFELRDGTDTMESMRAVLDSNFWLATHVTTVTIGYSAGLLAGALAHVYIFARLLRRGRPDFLKSVARMVYGVLCFGVFFAFIGTVLGGVWANYSWGRFWGWDPKENGALLIIIWFLIVLHGRLGGYLRDLGLCVTSVFGGIVVSFSWWGVNLLGVGLHSYGFTAGIMGTLVAFWTIEFAVMLAGLWAWLRGPGPHAA